MKYLLKQLITDTQGQDLVEYSLLLVFMVTITAVIAGSFHGSMSGVAGTTEASMGYRSSVAH